MSRVKALVEGHTEEAFVRNTLGPHLKSHGVIIEPILFGSARKSPGGIGESFPYEKVFPEIALILSQNPEWYVTTMFDYYGRSNTWPGRTGSSSSSYPENVAHEERELEADIATRMGNAFSGERFIAYYQAHEFESMLFSDTAQFASLISQPTLANRLAGIVSNCGAPEKINDTPNGAPSARLKALNAKYSKGASGARVASKIGLSRIRIQCPHFDEWVTKLEALSAPVRHTS